MCVGLATEAGRPGGVRVRGLGEAGVRPLLVTCDPRSLQDATGLGGGGDSGPRAAGV